MIVQSGAGAVISPAFDAVFFNTARHAAGIDAIRLEAAMTDLINTYDR